MSSSDNVHTIVEHAATDDVPCEECGGDTMAPYRDARGHVHDGYYCEGCGWTTHAQPHAISHTAAVDLVERAGGDTLTAAAKARLVGAIRTHNDGRVERFTARAAMARGCARDADEDEREGYLTVWATALHGALGESWPIGHPGYRRHEG